MKNIEQLYDSHCSSHAIIVPRVLKRSTTVFKDCYDYAQKILDSMYSGVIEQDKNWT